MNNSISSSHKDGWRPRPALFYLTLYFFAPLGGAQVFETLTINQSSDWENITVVNDKTPSGALIITGGAKVNANNTLIDVLVRGGVGLEVRNSQFTADLLKININTGQNRAVGINIDPFSQVDISRLTLTHQGKGEGLLFSTGDTQRASAFLSQSSISTQDGTGIRIMFGDLTLDDVNVSARGDYAHAIDANTGGDKVTITGGQYSTEGLGSHAIWLITHDGWISSFDAKFSTLGDYAHAVSVQSSMAGSGKSEAHFENSSITTAGNSAFGLYTEGDITALRLEVATQGVGSHAALAARGGLIELYESRLSTKNSSAMGLVSLNNSKITAESLQLTTTGEAAHGVYSQQGKIFLVDSSVETSGKDAAAVLMVGNGSTQHFPLEEITNITPQVNLDKTTATSLQGPAVVALNGANYLEMTSSQLSSQVGQTISVVTTVDDNGNKTQAALYVDAVDSIIQGEVGTTDTNNRLYLNLWGDLGLFTGTTQNVNQLSLRDSTWVITGNSQLQVLENYGHIGFADNDNTSQLVIDGNYSGSGRLAMNANLTGDDSLRNKLLIKGDVEPGTTLLTVKNLGGRGAQTVEGIEMISVGGTSYGQFLKEGRIVAGAYEYDVVKKGESWFLTSGAMPDPDPTPDPEPTPDPTPDPRPEPTYRVEAGSYLANYVAGNTLFTASLFDRESDPFNYDTDRAGTNTARLWLRQVGGRSGWSETAGQLSTKANRYVAQLGGELLHLETAAGGRWSTGIMAGYGHHNSTTASRRVGYRSKGGVNGYSVGLYSTRVDQGTGVGGYLDSWLLYNWFNNSVKGDELPTEYYRSHGITASIEAGYAREILAFYGSLGSEYRWYLMPSAQLVYQGVQHGTHREKNNTRVTNLGQDNLQSKLGVRSWIRGRHQMDQHTNKQFEPYAELNWIHNLKRHGIKMDDQSIRLAGAEHIAEIKLGLDAQLTPQLMLWANTGVQLGNDGYNDNRVMFGTKWHF